MPSRKKLATSKSLQLLLNKYMFDIVYNSEETEGYSLEENIVTNKFKNPNSLQKENILKFLQLPNTKVVVVIDDKTQKVSLFAKNLKTNATIEIGGLGDHFIAFVMTVLEAKKIVSKLEKYKNGGGIEEPPNILTHQFIKALNLQLQPRREGEIGIGEYRYLDYNGKPADVQFRDVGRHITLETARNGNVVDKMSKLVKLINEEGFIEDDPFMDLADFHSTFIKIHPFREGNGRTCRLLTNYFLMIKGMDLFDVNENNKQEYYHCLDFINCNDVDAFRRDFPKFDKYYIEVIAPQIEGMADCYQTRLVPFAKFLKDNLIKESSHVILRDVLNYENKNTKLTAEEVIKNI